MSAAATNAGTKTSGWTPRIARIDAIVQNCLFHVGSGTENFRVTQFGGEREFTQQMVDSAGPGDVFFDVGACIGFVAVHVAKRGAKVVAFEPEPTFRARLRENLTLNQLQTVQVAGWAVSDVDGTMPLFTDGAHGTSPSLAASGPRASVNVRTGTIDSAIATGEIPAPSLVKLDVEGAEVRALRGMRRLLRSDQRPRMIFIEVHPPFIRDLGDEIGDIERILTESGYERDMQKGRFDQLHEIWHAR